MKKIHLDTDMGGDIDDLCTLAMLLRWPEELLLTGITTVGDTQGRRAGYVRYVLGTAERSEIPVAAGADTSQGFYRYTLGLPVEGEILARAGCSFTNYRGGGHSASTE